ncbi:MAG: DUF3299 domain-containing protein [Bacteroidia bacterium]
MRFSIFILALLLGQSAHSQQLIDWKILESTTYEYTPRPDQFDFEGAPVFPDQVKALDGKKVRIKGYLIPLDVDGWDWALSAFPFSSCFFCGGAGKESVMSLQVKKPLSLSADEVREFVGILRLQTDPDGLTFVLEQAKLVSN